MTAFLYHGSTQTNLETLEPKTDTSGRTYVFAAPDPLIALFFIRNGEKYYGHLSLKKFRNDSTGLPALRERYPGAFDDAYAGVSGSIYLVPAAGFEAITDWDEERINGSPVTVEKETFIPDVRKELLDQKEAGKIDLFMYPDKSPSCSPDNRDLLKLAPTSIINRGIHIWDLMKKHHPSLCPLIAEEFNRDNLLAILPTYWTCACDPRAPARDIARLRKEFDEYRPRIGA